MERKTIKQNAFKLSWERDSEILPEDKKFLSMRPWQKSAFRELSDAPYMILNAPMGSGKSLLMCLLSAYKMKMNNSLRTIITVPQTIIAAGFVEAKLQMADGEFLNWQVRHNLCSKGCSKGTVNYIINWLSQSQDELGDKVLLCTHATIVKTYKKLKAEGRLDLLGNLLFWVDEAHHVKNIAMEDVEGGSISNGLGELITFFVSDGTNNHQVGLTTASFFRGDRCSLLTPVMERQFKRFNLPCDEYLSSMKNLESFSFDFLLSGHAYTKTIGSLLREGMRKDIIYIPHSRSRHSTGDKYQEAVDIIGEYQKTFGGEVIDTCSRFTVFKKDGDEFKILNLVDENLRVEKKEFVNSSDINARPDGLDVIIALGMFKEGANWVWADRIIIVGARDSLVDVVQMIGRLFRDAEGKKHVEVVQLLPFSLDQQNDDFQENLNNYLKAIYASLILEDVLSPVKLKAPKGHQQEGIKDHGDRVSRQLSNLIPDESTRLSLVNSVVRKLAETGETPEGETKALPALYDEYQKNLPQILADYNIHDHHQEIGEKIWAMLARRSLSIRGISVEDIDFEIIQKTHPLEGLLRYTSGACGIDTLKKFREAIRLSHEENAARWKWNYNQVEAYATANGHSRVPKNYEIVTDGDVLKLGSWYSDQRKNFEKLSSEKQELLSALPGFIPKKFIRNKSLSVDAWIDLYIRVSKKLGTPLIPNTHIEDGFSLGAWIQHIRKNDEWQKLTHEQIKRLFDHNFKLSPNQERNEATVLAMSQFAEREGTTVPKTGHKEEVIYKDVKYSIRLDNLRNKIKKIPNEIEPLIFEGLRKLPNFFEALIEYGEDDQKWLYRYEQFKEDTGKIIIPQGHLVDGRDLFEWNKKVRTKRNLDDSFKDKLLAIEPHFFSEHSVRLFMQDLKPRIDEYIKANGNALIPQDYIGIDGYTLGKKVSDLRERKDKLAEPIRRYLDSLGNKWAWNYFEYIHLQGMQRLLSHLSSNGNQELSKEMCELRSKIKQSLLKYPSSEQYKQNIENLAPGIFDDPKDENYLALVRYADREGHACPPIKHIEDGKKIGIYVSNIRQKYKHGQLSIEQQAKYECFNGWRWNASSLQSSTARRSEK